MYLPAYSPWLAPIELTFSHIKLLLKKQNILKTIDLNTKLGRDEVFKALKSLTSSRIRGYYSNFLKEIKAQLESVKMLFAKEPSMLRIERSIN